MGIRKTQILCHDGDVKKQTRSRASAWKTGLFLAAVAAAAKLPMLAVPLNRDEGAYAMIARALTAGNLVYRDLVEFKPPLLYALYLPLALFPEGGPALFRALALVYHAVPTILLWSLALRLFSVAGGQAARSGAVFAALIYAVAASDPNIFGHLVSAEMLMNMVAAAGMLALIRGPRWSFGSGALLAAAALVKQQAVTYLALPLILPFLDRRRRPVAAVIRAAAGAAAVFLAAALALAAAGLLVPAVGIFLWAGKYLVAQVPMATSLRNMGWSFQTAGRTQWPLWAAAGLGFAVARMPRPARAPLAIWLACAGLSLLIGRRPYQHHLQQLLPPLALAAGWTFARIVSARRRPAWASAAGIVLAAGILHSVWLILPLATASRDAKARMLYPVNSFLEAEYVAAWLEENTPEDSSVLIAGSEPEITWLSRRRPAGRYPLMYHLTAPAPGIEDEQARWLKEASAASPAAVVNCTNVKSWRDPSSSGTVTESLRRKVRAFLDSGSWRKAAEFGPFEIYVRRS